MIQVVEGGSIVIGDARERRDTIHADHINMVKFTDATDDGYRKVLHAIKMLLEIKADSAGQSTWLYNICFIISYHGAEPAVDGELVFNEDMTYYDVPPLDVLYYVERKKLFTRLEELFRSGNTSRRRIVVLLGMGGVGKTQLALRFCRHMKDNGKLRGIFWLDGSSRNALNGSMLTVCKHLLPDRMVDNPRDGVDLVRATLSNWSKPWLLVIDNLDNLEDFPDIIKFFPDSRDGHILITSRSGSSRELGEVIEVERMEKNEGMELLLHSSSADAKDTDAVEKILSRVEYLPLAIDQVRAYISKQQLGLVDFEEEYERRKRRFMKETPPVWQYRRTLPGNPETPLSLLTTWELSFKPLGDDMEYGGKLGDVLTMFGFLHPVSIREGLFSRDIGDARLATSPMRLFEEDGEWNHEKFEQAIILMREHSLVQFSRQSGDEIVVSLHPMVSEWLRMRLEKGMLSTSLKMAALHLQNYVESVESMGLEYVYRQEGLLHVDTICRFGEDEGDDFLDIYVEFGWFYARHGRLDDAERLYGRALYGYEKAFGAAHKSTLDTVHYLGLLYVPQGRLAEAEQMYDRALAGYAKAFGADHPSTLATVNNLGNLYATQGRLAEAEQMYNRALAGKEKAFGADYPSALNTVLALGTLYSNQGRLAEAEQMYDRALAGYEKAFGADHSSTLETVHNLGNVYSIQGRLAEAEQMYDRALAGQEKAFGADHPSTLAMVHSLGLLYADQGHLAEAEQMYDRALAGYEKAFGADHSSTLDTVQNLGNLYAIQGRLAEAEQMCDRALAGKEKAFGADHPSTLATVNNLGLLYVRQGRLAEAEQMYDRALAGTEKAFGADHPSTLAMVHNLGLLYADQGRLAEAEQMYDRALAGYAKAFGADHSSTLDTVHALGTLYSNQGRLAEAEQMYDRALAGREKALGAGHISTLETVDNLGLFYAKQRRLGDAERMYDRALAGREKVLGREHTSTLDTVRGLGDVYRTQGRVADADNLLRAYHLS